MKLIVCMQSIKEHNLKANHNDGRERLHACGLYAIYQRTQSESKSQPLVSGKYQFFVCMQSIKEHNLKANHNHRISSRRNFNSVCNLSKNTIWKQITTCYQIAFIFQCLYAIYQRTQSESKSQLRTLWQVTYLVCMQSIKEHNLKANHNYRGSVISCNRSVCNLSKNTIWKQITTRRENY